MTRLTIVIYIFLCICTLTISAADKEIIFLDPVIVGQSFFDNSESQHSPNLILDADGYSLTYHIDGINGFNVKTIRLLSEPQFNTTTEYYLFDSTQIPLSPTVQQVDSKKILFYYDLLINEPTNDTLFKQKLLMYDNDIPSKEEIESAYTFYTVNKANSNPPQFAKTTNRVYSEMIKNELSSPNNNKKELFLRSLDAETSGLYPLNLHFSANGKTAIIPYGDSLIIVKSWVFCTGFENLTCSKWATGYKAYVIYENRIKSIHSLSSKDVTDINQQPDDIFVRTVNGEHLFALRQSSQLMRINFETMRFENVLDLTLFTDRPFKKIIPVQIVDSCIVVLIDENHDGTIMRFDPQFQFVDSVSIPLKGDVSEFSDFVYDASQNRLSYAYATNLFDNSSTSYIFLQSVLFDKELILNPPTELPSQFTLSQNYPNPFNPKTTFNYTIPQYGHLTVDIYNMLGQKISTLYDDNQTAGEHELDWDATNQSSGIYLFKVSYDDQTKSIKTMLLK